MRIAYAAAGEGPPLVLLHGGWGDHRHWRRQLEGLSGDFAVAAWDTPGCGESSDPPGGWAMADYADCLAAWIDAAGIERPHVLGLSWGSTLALEFYRRHPAVPSSLVLAGGYAGWAGSLPPEVVAERLARAEASSDARRRNGRLRTSQAPSPKLRRPVSQTSSWRSWPTSIPRVAHDAPRHG